MTTSNSTLNCVFFLLGLLTIAPNLKAQQPNWKKLRQQGANFYEIDSAFERQNEALLQSFRQSSVAL